MAEHLHTRAHAGLFDVSHMGQAMLTGADVAHALERLVPGDIVGLKPGRQRYTLLTNEAGGIIDDLMVARLAEDRLFLVVNASRKAVDFDHLAANLPETITLTKLDDRALLALQGPEAAAVMTRLSPAAAALPFMGIATVSIEEIECLVSRSGYTGEDGFEISVPAEQAETLANTRSCSRRSCRSALAPAIRCGWRPAVPVRQRPRRTHHSDRGRPDLGDRQAAQGRLGFSGRAGGARSAR